MCIRDRSNIAGEEIMLSFTPPLIPQKRGILSTLYINLNKPCTSEAVLDIYKEFYKDEFFVRVKAVSYTHL